MEPHQASKGTHSPRVKTKVTDRSNMEEVSAEQKGKETHSLQVLSTANTKGTNLPEVTTAVTADGEPVMHCDSNSGKLIPTTECIMKADAKFHWDNLVDHISTNQDHLKHVLYTTMGQDNHTTGIHTMQQMYGCELDDDNTTRIYERYTLDGKDFIILNPGNQTWTAATAEALSIKQEFENNGYTMYRENYLQNNCIDLLRKCVSYGRETLDIKVPDGGSYGGSGGGSEGGLTDIIVGGVVAVLVLVLIFAVFLSWKKISVEKGRKQMIQTDSVEIQFGGEKRALTCYTGEEEEEMKCSNTCCCCCSLHQDRF